MLRLFDIAAHGILRAVEDIAAMAAKLRQQQRPEMPCKILCKDGKIPALVHHPFQQAQRSIPVIGNERFRHIEQKIALHAAENTVNILCRYLSATEGNALIRQRKGIPHAALRRPGNRQHAFFFNGGAGILQHALHAGGDIRHTEAVEIEPLAP